MKIFIIIIIVIIIINFIIKCISHIFNNKTKTEGTYSLLLFDKMDPSTLPSSSGNASETNNQFWSDEEDMFLFILIKNRCEIVESESSEDTKERLWIEIRECLNNKFKTDRDMNSIKERWEKLKSLAKLDIYTLLSKIKQKSPKKTSYRPSHFNLQIWKLLKPHKRKQDECDDAMEYSAYMLGFEVPQEIDTLLDNLIRISDIVFDPYFASSSSSSSNLSSERSRSLSPPRTATSPRVYRSSRSRSAQPRISSYMTYSDLTQLSDEDNEEGATARIEERRSMLTELRSLMSTDQKSSKSTESLVGNRQRQLPMSELPRTLESDLHDEQPYRPTDRRHSIQESNVRTSRSSREKISPRTTQKFHQSNISSFYPNDKWLNLRESDITREEPAGAADVVERIIPGSALPRAEPPRSGPSRTESTQHGAQSLHQKDRKAKIKESHTRTSDDSREERASLRARWTEPVQQSAAQLRRIGIQESDVRTTDDSIKKRTSHASTMTEPVHQSAAQPFHPSEKRVKIKESDILSGDDRAGKKPTVRWSDPIHRSTESSSHSNITWIQSEENIAMIDDTDEERPTQSQSRTEPTHQSGGAQWFHPSDKWTKLKESQARPRDGGDEERITQTLSKKEPSDRQSVRIFEPSERWIRLRDSFMKQRHSSGSDEGRELRPSSEAPKIKPIVSSAPRPIPFSDKRFKAQESDIRTSDENEIRRAQRARWKEPIQSSVRSLYRSERWIRITESDKSTSDDSGEERKTHTIRRNEPLHQSDVPSFYPADKWIKLKDSVTRGEDSSGSGDDAREVRAPSQSRIDSVLHGDRWIRLRESDVMVGDSSGSSDEAREIKAPPKPPRIDPSLHGVKPFHPTDRWIRLKESEVMVGDSSESSDEAREVGASSEPPRIDPALHGVRPFHPTDRWFRLRESNVMVGDSSGSSDEPIREVGASSEPPRIDPALHGVRPFHPTDRWIRLRETDVMVGDSSGSSDEPVGERRPTRIDPALHGVKPFHPTDRWIRLRETDVMVGDSSGSSDEPVREVRALSEPPRTDPYLDVQPLNPNDNWTRYKESVRTGDDNSRERTMPTPPRVETIYQSNDPRHSEAWITIKAPDGTIEAIPMGSADMSEEESPQSNLPTQAHVQPYYPESWLRIRDSVMRERGSPVRIVDSNIEERASAPLPNPPRESWFRVRERTIAETNIRARPADSNIEVRPSVRTLPSQSHVQSYYPIPQARVREPIIMETDIPMRPADSDIQVRPSARTLPSRPYVQPCYSEPQIIVTEPIITETDIPMRPADSDIQVRPSARTLPSRPYVQSYYPEPRARTRESIIMETNNPVRSADSDIEVRPLARTLPSRPHVQPYYPEPRARTRESITRERVPMRTASSEVEIRPPRTLPSRPRVLPHYEESWVGIREPFTRERNIPMRSSVSDPDIRSSSSSLSTPHRVLPAYANRRVVNVREPDRREGLSMRSTGVPTESRSLMRSEADQHDVYLSRLRETIIEEEDYYRLSEQYTPEESIRRLQILRIRERELFIRESQYLEEQIRMQRLESNLETAQMRKRIALSEYKLAELKEIMLELNINDPRSQARMTGQSGSGSNRGGRAGAIREAGGAFGQMEIAHEDQYFYNQQKEQIRKLREGIRDEIAFHEEQIRRHQEAIERHNARMAEMRTTEH
uniref:uncharacterized protein LOC127068344 isoform X2 n=1 Tax=Vespula vulgaris TaxID=7454 RepID=UPI00223A8EB2|nr:uncharacterized protein LOC127068344 isoform X2 [Vespula vulgaris]